MKKCAMICLHCGGIAFYFKKKPSVGDAINADNIIHSDKIKAGDFVTCQKCKKKLSKVNLNIKHVKNI